MNSLVNFSFFRMKKIMIKLKDTENNFTHLNKIIPKNIKNENDLFYKVVNNKIVFNERISEKYFKDSSNLIYKFPSIYDDIETLKSLLYQSYNVLLSQVISRDLCVNCNLCVNSCPSNALYVDNISGTVKFSGYCKKGNCGNCVIVCPVLGILSEIWKMRIKWVL